MKIACAMWSCRCVNDNQTFSRLGLSRVAVIFFRINLIITTTAEYDENKPPVVGPIHHLGEAHYTFMMCAVMLFVQRKIIIILFSRNNTRPLWPGRVQLLLLFLLLFHVGYQPRIIKRVYAPPCGVCVYVFDTVVRDGSRKDVKNCHQKARAGAE